MTTVNSKLSFWRTVGVALGLMLLGSSCTYTYIPPIPRGRVEPDPSLDLHASAGLQQTAQGLTLLLTAQDVPEADWLAVQWFAPDNSQVASASQWLTPNRNPQDVRFRLPTGIAVTDGDWRAVVSFQNRVARQFSLPVGEPEPQADDAADAPTPDAPIPEDDIPEGAQLDPPEERDSNDTSGDEPSSSETLSSDGGNEDDSNEDDGAANDAQDETNSPDAADESPASDAP
ncbi:MAG: hypothetical protein AAF708_04045 [Deinococcota bacterium]